MKDFEYHKRLVLRDFRMGLISEDQLERELDEIEEEEWEDCEDWDYYDD